MRVRRVAGKVLFSVHQNSMMDLLPQLLSGHMVPRLTNMSHVIHKMAFGPEFPGQVCARVVLHVTSGCADVMGQKAGQVCVRALPTLTPPLPAHHLHTTHSQVNPLDGFSRIVPDEAHSKAYKYYLKVGHWRIALASWVQLCGRHGRGRLAQLVVCMACYAPARPCASPPPSALDSTPSPHPTLAPQTLAWHKPAAPLEGPALPPSPLPLTTETAPTHYFTRLGVCA